VLVVGHDLRWDPSGSNSGGWFFTGGDTIRKNWNDCGLMVSGGVQEMVVGKKRNTESKRSHESLSSKMGGELLVSGTHREIQWGWNDYFSQKGKRGSW